MSAGDFVAVILTAVIGFVCGVILTAAAEERIWESRLVKSGHAEYYLDENHNRQWRMKETK